MSAYVSQLTKSLRKDDLFPELQCVLTSMYTGGETLKRNRTRKVRIACTRVGVKAHVLDTCAW
jgi:hypothetical protein